MVASTCCPAILRNGLLLRSPGSHDYLVGLFPSLYNQLILSRQSISIYLQQSRKVQSSTFLFYPNIFFLKTYFPYQIQSSLTYYRTFGSSV